MSSMIRYTTAVVVLLLCCNSDIDAQQKTANGSAIPLAELVAKLPANDGIEQSLICEAILQYGAKGVNQMLNQLKSTESGQVLKAQYAIDGLNRYVNRNPTQAGKSLFVSVLENGEYRRCRLHVSRGPEADESRLSHELVLHWWTHPPLVSICVE